MNPVSLLLVIALLSTANLYIATILPFNERSKHLPSHLTALSRQAARCQSPSDCGNGQICVNRQGVCTSGNSCDGVCITEKLCSCAKPCGGSFTCARVGNFAQVDFTTCVPTIALQTVPSFGTPIDCSGASGGTPGSGSKPASGSTPGADGSDGTDGADGTAASNGGEESGAAGGGSSDDGVCIGVDMLNNFASRELVFKKHVLARVLCDAAGSCATKGHIVNYKGRGMMMKRYCDIVGCKGKVMLVNSPRYERGLKVESRSEDMHFTAFAARYETSAEEAVLAAAVRVGL